ncbi:17834_t:CDS:10, partial [Racocetra persica]
MSIDILSLKTKENIRYKNFLAVVDKKIKTATVDEETVIKLLKKLLGEKNFVGNTYKGGINQQEIRNLLESIFEETNKENINTIEQKLGGSQNFQDGVYKGKEIINTTVVEGLDAKGEAIILKKIHDIFGPGEFYPIKGGEGVPPGREGCRKNAEEIAMMQAQEQKKIRAIEEWDDFFDNKHFISDATQKKIWMDKFPGNPKAAENVYKEAILKGESIVGEDFTRTEEDQINKAKTPEQITEVLKSIPEERRKKAPNGLINNDKIIANYTTKVLVMGQEHQQTTTHLETLKHLAEEVDKVHEFIVKRIETETNLDKFPSEEEIKTTYLEKKVPDTRRGYEIPKDKTNAEEKLDISQRGTHLLKFFYDKCKDGKVEEEIEVIGGDKGNSGHLAIGTGIGAKGETEMVYVRRGTMERATEEDIKEGRHDPEMKSLYKSHGSYPKEWKKAKKVYQLCIEDTFKDKLIPKDDTIIIFDEADYNDAGYQSLQFEMIKAGYKVLRMSATFPGAEFSATSSYPMKRIWAGGPIDPNMPMGLMKFTNADQVEKLEQMRGVPTGSIKWQDENGLPVPVEVNAEEAIQNGITWVFVKSLKINDAQRRALGTNTSYLIYTPEFDENCEDVSYGQPRVSSGATETTNLGKYFTYSEPTLGFTPIGPLIQQTGRVARKEWGNSITLTKECGEMDLTDNVSAAMVKAAFDGNIKQINDKEYKQIYDIDILRGAVAYPDPKTFGKAPEEILMGLKITKDQQSKKEKLTQLEQSKNTLKEMISNFITQDRKYPQGLDLKNQAKFISSVFGAKLDQGKKEEVIKETRTVLNGLVEAKINELVAKDYDETNKRSKNPNTIKKLAGLYNLTNAEIDYGKEINGEENIKEFLQSDADITKSESLKKLTEEAITEDTMDGYRNLLKSFRKSYDELVKLKGNEDNANNFLERMTAKEVELELRTKELEKKNGQEQHQIDELKEEVEELKNIIKKSRQYFTAQAYIEAEYPKFIQQNIRKLDISNLDLRGELNLSNFTKLEELNCANNLLTRLDLSGCDNLKKLNGDGNDSLKVAGFLPQDLELCVWLRDVKKVETAAILSAKVEALRQDPKTRLIRKEGQIAKTKLRQETENARLALKQETENAQRALRHQAELKILEIDRQTILKEVAYDTERFKLESGLGQKTESPELEKPENNSEILPKIKITGDYIGKKLDLVGDKVNQATSAMGEKLK